MSQKILQEEIDEFKTSVEYEKMQKNSDEVFKKRLEDS